MAIDRVRKTGSLSAPIVRGMGGAEWHGGERDRHVQIDAVCLDVPDGGHYRGTL